MDLKDTLIILSTVLGPILAVQAQKSIERIRERRNRKSWVFNTLMASRAARLAADHVQALNLIDLAFYGIRIIGIAKRSSREQAVLDSWHEYLDHLGAKVDDAALAVWNTQREELFTNLLFAMAMDLGYKFDRVQLKKGAYSPIAHGELEQDQTDLRKLGLKLLSGQTSIKMDVCSLPLNEDVLRSQLDLQRKLSMSFNEDGSMRVRLEGEAE